MTPRVAIVSSAEIAEQGTLNAEYWVDRQPGESYPQWLHRRKIEETERRAANHEAAAARLRAAAAQLRADPPQSTTEQGGTTQ